MKGILAVTGVRCACGFTEAGDETITDHLLEAFVPADGMAADGRAHEEGDPAGACLCGAAFAGPRELDAHFIAAFTPSDSVGRDGKRHIPQRRCC
jgi:hypothetical protein